MNKGKLCKVVKNGFTGIGIAVACVYTYKFVKKCAEKENAFFKAMMRQHDYEDDGVLSECYNCRGCDNMTLRGKKRAGGNWASPIFEEDVVEDFDEFENFEDIEEPDILDEFEEVPEIEAPDFAALTEEIEKAEAVE